MGFLSRFYSFIKFKTASYLYSPLSNLKGYYIDENGLTILKDISDLLEFEKIQYWLDGGTLLGVVRDNRLIDGDIDIDIGILIEDAEVLYSCLLKNRYNICYFYEDAKSNKCIIRAEKYNIGVDFEIFKKGENNYYRDSPRIPPKNIESADKNKLAVLRYEFDNDLLEDLSSIDFFGVFLRIPKDYDRYLSVYYSDWRVRENLKSYAKKNFGRSVWEYEHHNSSARYKEDEFLYFFSVSPSTIKTSITQLTRMAKSTIFRG
jgi:phosphorylcholine metabolism protein LicD